MDVSVIIPVYNAEKYLKACLSSVLMQEGVSFEALCIDDASTDLSADIVEEFASFDNRLILIRNMENHGQAYARNIGIENAKGTYLYFLDSDDELSDPHALQRLLAVAQRDKVDCVCFDSKIEYETEELRPLLANRERLHEETEPGIYEGDDYFNLFFGNPGFSVAVWRQFWKRQFLDENMIRFVEETSPHEDLLFTFQAYYLAGRISYVADIMHKYRFRLNSSTSGGMSVKRIRAYQRIYIESLRFLDEHSSANKRHLENSIQQYLRSSLSQIYIHYGKLISDGKELGIPSDGGYQPVANTFINWTIMQKFPLLERTFKKEEIDRIKCCDNLLVYGAGNYSVQIQQMLLDFGLSEYKVCVSKKSVNETEIGEMRKLPGRTVVILATTSMYRDEMRNMALSLGFDDIIELGDGR